MASDVIRAAFEDLTEASLAWLGAPDPSDAFGRWLLGQPQRVQIGFAYLGIRPPFDRYEHEITRVVAQRERIRTLVEAGQWRDLLLEGVRRSFELIRVPLASSVVVLVGVGRSNASAAYWHGEGRAFIWLENWLGSDPRSGLQDLDLRQLPLSVAHELGHGFRAVLPETTASEPRRLDTVRSVWDAWDERLRTPLEEVLLEEGLATAFSWATFPEVDRSQALFMDPEATAWLDEQWEALLEDRRRRWDFARIPVDMEWMADALFLDTQRRAPWTVEHPPSRWGYYVGLRWAQAAYTGGWATTLAAARVPSEAPRS